MSSSQQHSDNASTNAGTNVQPMTISQTIQSQNNQQPQDNIIMAEYSFFYKTYNDLQVYHITCKEISIKTVLHLLSNHDCLTQSNTQSSNLHVFYFQHPDDNKIYQVICEAVSYTYIIWLLNMVNYCIELNQQYDNLVFSKEVKENLEFHLKQDLISYLAPIENQNHEPNFGQDNTSQQDVADNNFITFQQDNNDQFITSQNSVQDHNNTDIRQP